MILFESPRERVDGEVNDAGVEMVAGAGDTDVVGRVVWELGEEPVPLLGCSVVAALCEADTDAGEQAEIDGEGAVVHGDFGEFAFVIWKEADHGAVGGTGVPIVDVDLDRVQDGEVVDVGKSGVMVLACLDFRHGTSLSVMQGAMDRRLNYSSGVRNCQEG